MRKHMSNQQFLGEIKWVGEPQAYVDYGARSSLQPVQTPKGGPVGPVAPKPSTRKQQYRITGCSQFHPNAMPVGAKLPSKVFEAWCSVKESFMATRGEALAKLKALPPPPPKTQADGYWAMWWVLEVSHGGSWKEVANSLKGFSVNGADEGLGQVEEDQQRLVDFLESEAKLSGVPSAFLGEMKWVGFGYDEGTPVWQPGLSEEEKKSYFPWGQYSDATKNLQLAINSFLSQKGCGTINPDGKLGAGTCGAAKKAVELGGPEGVIGPPPTCKSFGPPPTCGAPKPPPVEPQCSPTKLCPPGQKCEGGTCVPIPAPPAAAPTSKSGSGLGLLVLGAAGVGLALMASKSQLEKIPQHPSRRLQENKHGKRRRRY